MKQMKHIKTLVFWKDIPGYEELYQINQFGEIKSLPKPMPHGGFYPERILTHKSVDKDGYYRVSLCKDGNSKMYRLNRLVAMAFLPNPEGYEVVDHINRDKKDNRVSNLQWISAAGNTIKDCGKKPRCIETGQWYVSLSEAQRQTGVDRRSISRCCEGQQKTAGKLHWEWC